jgi:hypothetical protein
VPPVPSEGLPPRAPLTHDVMPSGDETVRLKSCRFVVDAVHPKCGAVFLFYCAPKEVSLSSFYVALCDERSRNKKAPVAKKTLDVVSRIEEIVIQKKVIRDERFTFLGSAPNSRSTSCSSVGDAAEGGHNEQPWMEVLLALCDEATGETVGDDVHSFTQECKRLSHEPEDVRRLYQWTVCSSGILPLHLSLRQLELTTSETSGSDQDEIFVAYCDPLMLPVPPAEPKMRSESVVSAASSGHAHDDVNGTPAKRLSTHNDAGDVLSPMTPVAVASASSFAENDAATVFAAYYERADRVFSITGRGLRTPPPAHFPSTSSVVLMKPNGTSRFATAATSPRGVERVSGLKFKKWDSTYL